jgi:hypothetical protein
MSVGIRPCHHNWLNPFAKRRHEDACHYFKYKAIYYKSTVVKIWKSKSPNMLNITHQIAHCVQGVESELGGRRIKVSFLVETFPTTFTLAPLSTPLCYTVCAKDQRKKE